VSEGETVILPFPSPCPPTKQARSTIVLSSLASLKNAGHYDRYVKLLDPAARDVLLQAVAGSWLPIGIGLAHYRACDALGLQPDAEVAMGRGTFEGAGAVIFGTVTRLAKGSGVSPWTVLPHFQRFWDRAYDGGGLRVVKLGPKDARIEMQQCPLADHRYFRNGIRGLVAAVFGVFTQRAYVKDVSGARLPGTMALRAQWV
jgi:hypothetical protein